MIRQVNDTLYTLQKVVEHGFATKDRCIILTEHVPESSASYARQLEGAGVLINIYDGDATRLMSRLARP